MNGIEKTSHGKNIIFGGVSRPGANVHILHAARSSSVTACGRTIGMFSQGWINTYRDFDPADESACSRCVKAV